MTCSVDTSFIGIFLASSHDLQHSQARVSCSYTKTKIALRHPCLPCSTKQSVHQTSDGRSNSWNSAISLSESSTEIGFNNRHAFVHVRWIESALTWWLHTPKRKRSRVSVPTFLSLAYQLVTFRFASVLCHQNLATCWFQTYIVFRRWMACLRLGSSNLR